MAREILQQGKGTQYDGPNGPYIMVEELHRAAVDGILHVHVPGDQVFLEAAKVSGLAKGKPAAKPEEEAAGAGEAPEGAEEKTYPVAPDAKAAPKKRARARK